MKAKELVEKYGSQLLSHDVEKTRKAIKDLYAELLDEGMSIVRKRKIQECSDSFFAVWDEIDLKYRAVCRLLSTRGWTPLNIYGLRKYLLSEIGLDLQNRKMVFIPNKGGTMCSPRMRG